MSDTKRHLQDQKVQPRNRDRFRVLESVHAELEAAGVTIDIGQLDWACRQVEQRLYEKSLDRQYDYERSRQAKADDTCSDFEPLPTEGDYEAEWEAIEKRGRDADRARS